MTQAERCLSDFHTFAKRTCIPLRARRYRAEKTRTWSPTHGLRIMYSFPDGSFLMTAGTGRHHSAWADEKTTLSTEPK